MPIRRLCRRRRNGPGHGCARAVAGGITRRFRSEVLEEFQERVRGLVAFLPAAGRGGLLDRFLLLMHVGVKVGLRAGQGFMPEPEGDDGDVDAGEQQAHGGRMSQGVDGHVLGGQGRAAGAGPSVVELDAPFDGVAGQPLPGWTGEQDKTSPGCPPRSASQAFRIRTVAGSSGVSRSFRPFPVQWTCGPAWIRMSAQVRLVSSETLRPAWTARASMAWSRRPVRVSWSQAVSIASDSSAVR